MYRTCTCTHVLVSCLWLEEDMGPVEDMALEGDVDIMEEVHSAVATWRVSVGRGHEDPDAAARARSCDEGWAGPGLGP